MLIARTPLFDHTGKFLRWLEIGTGQRDEQGNVSAQIDSLPVNPDDFTGYIRLSPAAAPLPPPPTRDECFPPNRD